MTHDLKSAEISSGQRVVAGVAGSNPAVAFACNVARSRRIRNQRSVASCVPVGMDVDGLIKENPILF